MSRAETDFKNKIKIENPLSLDRRVRNPNGLRHNTLRFGETLPATTLSPEEECIRIESTNRFRSLLESSDLEPDEKEFLHLTITHGLRIYEAANVMNTRIRDLWDLANQAYAKIQTHPDFPKVVEDFS